MATSGPKKPKKPKAKPIKLVNDEFAWISCEDSFEEGVEIFVCVEENTHNYEPLDTDTYTLDSGVTFEVLDGIVDSIG